ncbi:MAG: hypothetical protein AABO58_03690 [Acidobacteriota bacterium]
MRRWVHRFKSYSEIAKNIVEIAAFLAAAWWARHIFAMRDQPTLEPHVDGDAKLTWSDASTPPACEAIWTISVTNTGNTPVDIDSVQVRLWSFDPPPVQPGKITYLDLDETRPQNSRYQFDRTFTGRDAPLTGRLHPRDSFIHDFRFIVPRSAAGELIGFDAQLFERGHKSLLYIYERSKRCQPENPAVKGP